MTASNRRAFLKRSSSMALAPALRQLAALSAMGGIGALGSMGNNAYAAQDQSLVVGSWGGDYANLLNSQIITPLLAPEHVSATILIGDATSRMTKLRAERTVRRPSMDVACLSDTDMAMMSSAGLLSALDTKQIKNAENIFDPFRSPDALPHIFSGMVIVYNTDYVKTPPTSFLAALDPKFKGKVGLSETIFMYDAMMGSLASGKGASDLKAGMAFLKELKPNQPRVYPSNETTAAALKSGEIWMTCMWKARALQWKQDGLPVAFAFEKNGIIPVLFQAAIPKNNHAPQAAYQFFSAMLDPRSQLGFAQKMGYAPTIRNAGLPADLQERVGFTNAQIERFAKLDYAALTTDKPALLDYWSQDFKVGL